MTTTTGALDGLLVVLYLFGYLLLGAYVGSKGNNTVRDYALSGVKNISGVFLMSVLISSWINCDIGDNFYFSKIDLAYILLCLLDVISIIAHALLVDRIYSCFADKISIGEAVGEYYGKASGVIFSIANVITQSTLIGLQFFFSSLVLNQFFNISTSVIIYFLLTVTVIYSAFGGIRAVIIAELFQFVIIIICTPVGIMDIFSSLDVSISSFISSVLEENLYSNLDTSNIKERFTEIIVIMFPLLNPIIVQRIIIAKNSQEAKKALLRSSLCIVPFYFSIICAGLIAYYLNGQIDQKYFFLSLLDSSPWLKNLLIVGLLSTFIATISSFMNVVSVSLTHDILKIIFDIKNELIVAKFSVIIIGMFAAYIAIHVKEFTSLYISIFDLWAVVATVPLWAMVLKIKLPKYTFIVSTAFGLTSMFTIQNCCDKRGIGIFLILLLSALIFAVASQLKEIVIEPEK